MERELCRQRYRRSRIRDNVRAAHCVVGQGRRSHGAGRSAHLGSRPHQSVHVRQTVLMGIVIFYDICHQYDINNASKIGS